MKKIYCDVCGKNLQTLKYHTFLKKTLVLSIICSKSGSKDEMIFKEEESIEISKILGLINNMEQYTKNLEEENIIQE